MWERRFNFLAPLRSRLSKRQYLGVHLMIGGAVSVLALLAFIGITESVVHHDRLVSIDTSFASWLRGHITSKAVPFFRGISFLGSPALVGTVGVVASLVLAVKHKWIPLIALIAAFAGSGAINWIIKRVIQRPRPEYSFADIHDASFSFPSGHAMGSLAAYGMIAYLLTRSYQSDSRIGRLTIASTTLLVTAIGVSRLYLEVHYLTDVIAGYLAGAIWLLVCMSGVELTDFRATRSDQ